MTPTPKPGRQHGARDEILGRIRRALAVPSRPAHGHGAGSHTATLPSAPAVIAPDGSNPTGTNAAPLSPGPGVAEEGRGIGIRPVPPRAEDALEAQGWAPEAGPSPSSRSTSGPMSIPLPVINGGLGAAASPWRAWLPPVGESYEEQAALLERNLRDLRAELVRVPGVQALQVLAGEMARENGWVRIARHSSPLLDQALGGLADVGVLNVDGGVQGAGEAAPDALELEGCDAGWTACDALVAQTGSVLLSALSAGGRALSVLPPHHVVVATREQLVPGLPEAFEVLREKHSGELPSSLSFVTGPSRTGDIERILVLGAHGPKRLTILLVE